MAGLTDAGFEIKRLEDIDTELEEDIHGNVNAQLNLSSTSSIGQYKGSTASQLAKVWEALQSLWASWDRAQATGAALDRIGAYTGCDRLPATPSTVVATCTLAAGTYAANALVASVVGTPSSRFTNLTSVTTAGGDVQVTLTCEDTGPVRAPIGQLTVIANPIAGFTAVTNAAPAVLGRDVESNAAYRRRQELELARKGSTTVDAIRADLLEKFGIGETPLFSFVSVVENDTDNVVNGQDPHSFETLVLGSFTDADAAAAILSVKPAGIKAYGQTTATVNDSQGNPHIVGFTRPTDVNIYLGMEVHYLAGQFDGETALRDMLLAFADDNLGPGTDVIHAALIKALMNLPGVIDAAVAIGNAPAPTAEANYTIGSRQVARFDNSRITVTLVEFTGAP